MDFGQLLWGIGSGDMGALSIMFVLMLPFILVYTGIAWVINKAKTRRNK